MPRSGAYAVPKRFAAATFASYEPQHPTQVTAIRRAQAYAHRVATHAGRSWWQRLTGAFSSTADTTHGLYVVGPVGVGKTHLLAALYHELTGVGVPVAFLHSSQLFRDPLPPTQLAREIASHYPVCCLDEVELDDPANEVRLVRFLQTLSAAGGILMATSNVEPEHFLSSMVGTDRFQHFLQEQFRQTYEVIVVDGDDYRRRLDKPGHAWIGPRAETQAEMRAVCSTVTGNTKWITADALLSATETTPHRHLMDDLLALDALFIHAITVTSTDDALRLLRVVDALYTADEAPVLYFTSSTPPTLWFKPEAQHGKMAQGIAEKFNRTVSRLYAMCTIERLPTAAL